MFIYSKNCKILLSFTGMIVCFSITLMSFSWESDFTQPILQPSRRTHGDDDNASRADSLRHGQEHHRSPTRDTSVSSVGKGMIKNLSSSASTLELKRPVYGRRQQPQERLMTSAETHPQQLRLPKQKYLGVSRRKFLSEHSSKEITTNLSLSLQASQLLFERTMAVYSKQEIGQPVMYTRENIPQDLRALAPKLFRQFPREFLPEYKSPCWTVHNKTLQCLPYFFIGGFPKCATTDLWGKLMTHPSLVKTSKEPHWWTTTKFEDAAIYRYIHQYSKLVREMETQRRKDLITCDASALTFQDNKALMARLPPELRGDIKFVTADFIRAALPDLKIVGIMRNPTERAYSAYMYFNENGSFRKSPRDFHEKVLKAIEEYYRCTDIHDNDPRICAYYNMIPHLNTGCYSFYIREYFTRFPRDQLYFLRTGDWSNDPAHYMKEVFTFLDIDPMSEEYRQKVVKAGKLNRRKSSDRRLGPMLPQTRKLLDDFYKPCNEDLAKLLNDDKYLWRTKT